MDAETRQELRVLKDRLRSLEAYAETLLETQAIVLKSLQRADADEFFSKEELHKQLKQIHQDRKHSYGL